MKRIWNYLLVLLLFGVSSYGQNVGIGTATPARKLHIAGDMRLDNLVGSTSPYTTTTSLMIRLNNGDISGIAFSGNSSEVLLGNGTFGASPGIDHDWYEVGTTTPPTTINDDIYTQGQVGIGTSIPIANSRLHVAAPTYLIAVRGEGGYYGVYGTASVLDGAGVWGRAVGTNIDDTYGVIGTGGVNKTGVLGHIDGLTASYIANSGGSFTGTNVGAFGEASATNGAGVYGYGASANTYGVRGVGGTGRTGVLGYIDGGGSFYVANSGGSFTGANVGAYGRSTATTGGNGVYGYAEATTNGVGVYGYSASTTGGFGTYGTVGSPDGAGALGSNRNTQGTGVVGVGNNLTTYHRLTNGSGVAGTSINVGVYGIGINNNSYGGYFVGGTAGNYSSNNIGVYGICGDGTALNFDFIGVYGRANTTSANWGYGVYGYGRYRGVYGRAEDGHAGVVGSNGGGTSTYGVYAFGDIGASGTKLFVIDHPADPENKLLRHFCIESNEVLNIYRGNVVLDNNGQAEVQLPDYFHLINKNFSYNLTPIGGPAQLYILQEIDQNGKFIIAGGKPGQKVSWYVYAERNDPYLQKYPEKRLVEVEKNAKHKGKYIAPELYGQPAEKGIDYLINPEERSSKMEQLQAKTIKDSNVKSLEQQAQPVKIEKLEMNSVKVEKLEMKRDK